MQTHQNARRARRARGSAQPTRSGRRRHHAGDTVAHEARLLIALDLEGEAGDDLVPAAALLVDRDDLGAAADLGAHRNRGGEADLVPPVVDPQDEAGGGDQLLAEAVDEGEGQVAVGDRGAEGALVLRLLAVDVDPLVVTGELGEGVDVRLRDRTPLARPDLLPEQRLHPLHALNLYGCHRAGSLERSGARCGGKWQRRMASDGLEVCVAAEQLRVVAYRDHRDQAVRQLTGCLTTSTADPKQLGGVFEIGRALDT